MAANFCRPVVVPGNYDPMFKVDVNIHAPIRDQLTSESEFKAELLVHSLQLDTFCKQEKCQQTSGNLDHGKMGASFLNKANLGYCNVQQTLKKYRGVMHEDTFEREPYFADLFPSVVEYIHTGTTTSRQRETDIDRYFKQLNQLNQIFTLSQQIHKDIQCGQKPKYLAHQVAVLFRFIQTLPTGNEVFTNFRDNIEQNFQTLKDTIADLHDFEESLPEEVNEWLLDLTERIAGVIISLPTKLTQEIRPVAAVFQSG